MFHPLNGCDQVCFLARKRKKTGWELQKKFEDITDVLERLSDLPSKTTVDELLPSIEKFIVLLFDPESTCQEVNGCRQNIFAKKG